LEEVVDVVDEGPDVVMVGVEPVPVPFDVAPAQM
jgi:hypothetical protein